MMKKVLALCLTTLILGGSLTSFARDKRKKPKGDARPAAAAASEKKKDINSFTKSCRLYVGLFSLYQDTATGDLYMRIKNDQLDKEYIYFSQISDGASAAGFFRGGYRGSRIFKPVRYFDRIEFQVENTGYYYDESNALSKASRANINIPVIYAEKIAAHDSVSVLIKANDLFLGETFNQVKPSSFPGAQNPFNMGTINKERSKVLQVKNYPANTDLVVSMSYTNPYPTNYGDKSTTDARFVNVNICHSLIAMPQNNYKPRFDDPRVGYFMTQVEDMTDLSSKPYRDMIHRWHLEKKDPSAALSEPVEPITWWIENTTPVQFRETIREGVLRWNKVFEKAGFKNAVVVNIQPDTATWDAGDIRYNVLRWTSSPNPPFGGYGPSFVNPRTGQILGADVMLEYVYFGNIIKRLERFERAGLDYLDIEETDLADPHKCMAGAIMHNQLMFGMNAIRARSLNVKDSTELVRQALTRLVLHEVGHTLGLNHNMKASSIYSPAELKDKKRIKEGWLSNSIMEYPAINNALLPEDQTLYYDEYCGPYDEWAIEFGYSPALSDTKAEQERLNKILSRSADPMLTFGNDADDMRSNGYGIDPRVNIYDLSSDPVAFGVERIQLVNTLLPALSNRFKQEGDNWHELRNAYLSLTGELATQLRIISRQIGGVYVDRAFVGTGKGNTMPYTPVPYNTQKEAMKQLRAHAFGVKAFNEPAQLYNYLQQQRRGFNFSGNNEDPKIHDRILAIQQDLLNQLLNDKVLQRITDAAMYGNKYKLDEFMNDLTAAIVEEDLKTSVSTVRQNIQTEYVRALVNILEGKQYDNISQGNALAQLQAIKRKEATAVSPDELTRNHRAHLVFLINRALENK